MYSKFPTINKDYFCSKKKILPWLIHVNVWQKPLQYCKVISLQLINIHEKNLIYSSLQRKSTVIRYMSETN